MTELLALCLFLLTVFAPFAKHAERHGQKLLRFAFLVLLRTLRFAQ